jgi:hypothetical protein
VVERNQQLGASEIFGRKQRRAVGSIEDLLDERASLGSLP